MFDIKIYFNLLIIRSNNNSFKTDILRRYKFRMKRVFICYQNVFCATNHNSNLIGQIIQMAFWKKTILGQRNLS